MFGGRWSPSVSNFGLRKTADDNKDLFDAETVKTAHRNFYVDDLLKYVKTVEDAKKLYEQLTLMLPSGGLHVTKWICNNREVLDVIPHSEMVNQLRNLSFDIESFPIERALGLERNVEGDCFQFNISQKEKPHTRRGILSMFSSIFDPLGFVALFILSDKIILQRLQRLCKKGVDGMRLFLRKIYLSGKSGGLNLQSWNDSKSIDFFIPQNLEISLRVNFITFQMHLNLGMVQCPISGQ